MTVEECFQSVGTTAGILIRASFLRLIGRQFLEWDGTLAVVVESVGQVCCVAQAATGELDGDLFSFCAVDRAMLKADGPSKFLASGGRLTRG